MREQLKLLEELQKHDVRVQELEAERKAIPARLEEMRADLGRVEQVVAKEKQELDATETWRRDQEAEMKAEEQQMAKAKSKLTQVKTAKEYMATQREVETTKRMSQETEEKLMKVLEASETARTSITTHEQDVARLREVVQKEEEGSHARLAAIDAALCEARARRDSVTGGIRADLLKKYNSIRTRRSPVVVPVHGSTCGGCHVNIPPQLVNILQRGESLELCPSCHRIIFWEKVEPVEKPGDSN